MASNNNNSSSSPTSPPRLCPKCHDFVATYAGKSKDDTTATTHPNDNDNDGTVACCICGGLWGNIYNNNTTTTAATAPPALQEALHEACEPYGGLLHHNNLFAQPITISLGGRIRQGLQHYLDSSSSNEILEQEYSQALKKHVIAQVQSLLPSTSTSTTTSTTTSNTHSNRIRRQEQQGYLDIHILCIPSRNDNNDNDRLSPQPTKKKARRKGGGYAQRVYGHASQGGDPRLHLEERLQANGWEWTSWSQAIPTTTTTNTATPPTTYRMTYQVAVFRHPIFFYGYYTKHRRDVSQTPFIVMDKTMTTATNEEKDGDDTTGRNSTTTTSTTTVLGVTSVEEQICRPLIAKFGISKRNNTPHKPYGACKFHASGREDMNVRMILKKPTTTNTSSSSSSSSSCGRPFCVQLVDALMPLPQDDKLLEQELQAIVHRINHTTPNNNEKNDEDNVEQCWYGQNPMGVGIHGDFKLVSASYFSNLQTDTEDKIKHYGCHCWSEQVLPQEWTWELSEQAAAPLIIHQPTPLRVLHRRPNLIRDRAIYQATAKRIDDHHFRLELSTQAGTYIKEFVHGDLGRTQPNMNTLLQTKTNLLLLDCEGIEMSGTTTTTTSTS